MQDDCPWDDEDDIFDDLARLYERVDIEEARLQHDSEPAPEASNTAPVQRPDSAEMIARAARAEPPLFPQWIDLVEAYARAALLARLVQTSATGRATDLDGLDHCSQSDTQLVLGLAASAPTPLIIEESRIAAHWFDVLLTTWLQREHDTVDVVLAELNEELFGSWQHGDDHDF